LVLTLVPFGPRGFVLLGLVALAWIAAPSVAAQDESMWRVESAQMEVDASVGDGAAQVTIHYTFVADGGGALPLDSPIPFELLGFGEATTESFTVGSGPAISLAVTGGTHRSGEIMPPSAVTGEALPIEVRYRVEQAVQLADGRVRGRIPTLTAPPLVDEGSGFRAILVLPAQWSLVEGFPSGLRLNPSGQYEVSLPVVPAMIGFRGRTDGAWRPGIPLMVDLLMLTMLCGFAVFGWRHLSGVAAAANA
jgi:hypothetical protein